MSPVAGSPPQPIIPSGPTAAGFRFTAGPFNIGTRARIQVRFAAEKRRGIWASKWLDATEEPDGNLSYASPEPPALPAEKALRWRIRSGDDGGDKSPWSDWQEFSVTEVNPKVRPVEAGSVPALTGAQLSADVHLPLEADAVESYEVQIARRAVEGDPSLWEPPLVRLDSCPAKHGMKVGTTKPTARSRERVGRGPFTRHHGRMMGARGPRS